MQEMHLYKYSCLFEKLKWDWNSCEKFLKYVMWRENSIKLLLFAQRFKKKSETIIWSPLSPCPKCIPINSKPSYCPWSQDHLSLLSFKILDWPLVTCVQLCHEDAWRRISSFEQNLKI